MGKYPTQTCRDCALAEWVWSARLYPEGQRRIIVQQPGRCLAKNSLAVDHGKTTSLSAQQPFSACPSWRATDMGYPTSELAEDLDLIEHGAHLTPTEKTALTQARLGQGKFRHDVLALWNHKCAATKSEVQAVLQAAHIKRWRDSTDQERLDKNNGLALSANCHALFDAGLISFDRHGYLLISSALSAVERRQLGLKRDLKLALNDTQARYMHQHRFKP